MLLLALLPLLVLFVFGAVVLNDRRVEASDAAALGENVRFGVVATDLVHELQRERGLSSGFIGSADADATQMLNQRLVVDAARAEYDAGLALLRASDPVNGARFDLTLTDLGEIPAHRSAIDARSISIEETLAPYTIAINDILDALSGLDFTIADAELTQELTALRSLSRGKELTGLERGFANGVVARGSFSDEPEHARYVQLTTDALVHLVEFRRNSPAEELAIFDSEINAVSGASDPLQAELSAVKPGDPISFDENTWWTAMTARVDAMRVAEIAISNDITDIADTVESDGQRALYTALAVAAALTLLLIGISFFIARTITVPMRRLSGAALKSAEDDLPEAISRIAAGEAVAPQTDDFDIEGPHEIVSLSNSVDSLRSTAVELAGEQAQVRRNVAALFVSLGRRNQSLLSRQMSFIDQLERDEPDAGRLQNLYRLDHLSTRIRRNAESLLVIAGAESPRRWTQPIEASDMIRAALSETEAYDRVDVAPSGSSPVLGAAVSDLTHLLAELIENATQFSPPNTRVNVTSRRVADTLVITISDEGLGLSEDERTLLNNQLNAPSDTLDLDETGRLGLHVVARLAARHGVKVELQTNASGGTTARVELPSALVDAGGDSTIEAGGSATAVVTGTVEPLPAVADVAGSAAPTPTVVPQSVAEALGRDAAIPQPQPDAAPLAEVPAPASPSVPASPHPVDGPAAVLSADLHHAPVAPPTDPSHAAPPVAAPAFDPVGQPASPPVTSSDDSSPHPAPTAPVPPPVPQRAPTRGVASGVAALRDDVADRESILERRARRLTPIRDRAEAGETGALPTRTRKAPEATAPRLAHGPETGRTPEQVRSMLSGLAAGRAAAEANTTNSPHDPNTDQERR